MPKIWRPKDTKSRSIIKLGLWAGIIVWGLFFFAYAVIAAQRLGSSGEDLFGSGLFGRVLTWVTPIWVVFTSLLVIIYVVRFVNKKMGGKKN